MHGTGVIDHFLDVFTTYIDSGFGLLKPEIAYVATTLIVIDVTLAALFWAWGADEDILARLIKKTLFVGVFAYLIGNWNSLARIVFESFAGLGLKASGTSLALADFLRPGRIAEVGIDAGRPILDAIAKLTGFASVFDNIVQIGVLGASWAIVVLAFFVLAIQLFVALIEFKLTTLAGFVLVPFGLFGKTAFMAERVLGNVVSSGIKVLVLAVIVGIGSTLFAEFTGSFSGQPTIDDALAVVLAALSLLALGIFGPGIANGIVAGGPQLGAGAAVGAGLAVGGAAVAGLGAARMAAGAAGGVARGGAYAAGAATGGYRAGASGSSGVGSVAGGIAGVGKTAFAAAVSPLRSAAASMQGAFGRGGSDAGTGFAPRSPGGTGDGASRLGQGHAPRAGGQPRCRPRRARSARRRRWRCGIFGQRGRGMMFKRSGVRYGRTPDPETPYQRAGQVWDERIGSARVQARNWRLMALGELGLDRRSRGRGRVDVAAGHGAAVDRPGRPHRPRRDDRSRRRTGARERSRDRLCAFAIHRARALGSRRPDRAAAGLAARLRLHHRPGRAGAQRLCARQRPVRARRQGPGRGRRVERHPRLARQLPRRVGRAALRSGPARRDRALDRDPDRRAPAAARRRDAAQEPARHLRPRNQLVSGDGTMTRAHSRTPALAALLVSGFLVGGCAHGAVPPQADASAALATASPARIVADPPAPVQVVAIPEPLPLPGQLKPLASTLRPTAPEPASPVARVTAANAAARVQPTRYGYLNAVQLYPFSAGALYQVYASPGEVTDIVLQEGEALVGSGPVAAGDTARWIIGDTTSGADATRRVHILVKPTRPDLATNMVINTDRRTYHLELRATASAWMASVSWRYPEDELIALKRKAEQAQVAAPIASGVDLDALDFGYTISGDAPWRPLRAFDDGAHVYIEFPPGIAQAEMPPLFVVGVKGKGAELVNYRVRGRHMIVDRLFAAAELRLGGKHQQRVRIMHVGGRAA